MSQLSDLGKEAKHDFDEVSESKKDLPWYKRLSLTTWIFIALALGVVAGIALQGNAEFATTYIKPLGTIFLNLIKMIVVPLVIFTMTAGVISLSDIKRVGAIGGKTIVYYLATTAFAWLWRISSTLAAGIACLPRSFRMKRKKPPRSLTRS